MDKKTKSIGFMWSVVLSLILFMAFSIMLSSCRQDSIVPGDKPLEKRNVIVPGMDIGKRAVQGGCICPKKRTTGRCHRNT